jgi:hypothetical protein
MADVGVAGLGRLTLTRRDRMVMESRAAPGWHSLHYGPRTRFEDALRELIEAKMKGLSIKPRPVSTPAPVVDLMAALKRSLAREAPTERAPTKPRPTKAPDRRQGAVLLPLTSGRHRKTKPATESSVAGTSSVKRRREGTLPHGQNES